MYPIYTWTVTRMQVLLDIDSMLDVVYNVDFVVTAEKEGIKLYSKDFNVYLPQPLVGTDYIAYDDLTNDIVIGWCQQVLGPEFTEGVYTRLNDRIDLILSSQDPIAKPLPWS
jgi:hypothetical protein